MSDNLPRTVYAGKMDSDKTESLSNRSLISILVFGIGALSVVFYLVGPKNSPDTPSGRSTPQNDSRAMAAGLTVATAEEIDSWVKNEMQKSSRKVGIVNVWATWCEPCRKEMPELVKFQKAHPNIPVFLASADNENDRANVEKFLFEAGVDFPSRLIKAPQDQFIERWQTRSSPDPTRRWSMSLPVTFFLNKEGHVEQFLAAETNSAELKAIASNLESKVESLKLVTPPKPSEL